jgi:hypothetical protein
MSLLHYQNHVIWKLFMLYVKLSNVLFQKYTSTMAATRRLQKELADFRNSNNKSFRNIQVTLLLAKNSGQPFLLQVDESNILFWSGLLVPDKAPYNKVC